MDARLWIDERVLLPANLEVPEQLGAWDQIIEASRQTVKVLDRVSVQCPGARGRRSVGAGSGEERDGVPAGVGAEDVDEVGVQRAAL